MIKRAVLFDLDNTLYEYDPPHKKALFAVYKELKNKIKLSRKKFDFLFKISKQEIHRELSGTASAHNRILYFQRLIEKTHNTIEPAIILKLYEVYWNAFLKNMSLSHGVLSTLKQLKKQNYMIAIVSDMTTHIQLRKLKKLKITKYIDYLVTSEEAGSEKPHSIMFLLALNKLRLKPEEVIMVGDSLISDIGGANSVGIPTALIKKGRFYKQSEESYQKPNIVIKEIPEILDILKQ